MREIWGEEIYIPLCLYFNDTKYLNQTCRRCIYIPLCLYFNSLGATERR